jgi:protein TonB
MPAWIPATQHGIQVNQGVIIDIIFDKKNSKRKETKSYSNYPAVVEPPKPTDNINDIIFDYVEQNPIFIGGEDSLTIFIAKNLKYPQQAKENGMEGRVYVGFIIRIDGSITDTKIARGIGYGCDEEAIRLIKLMSTHWLPGKQNGKLVNTKYIQPITFQIPE